MLYSAENFDLIIEQGIVNIKIFLPFPSKREQKYVSQREQRRMDLPRNLCLVR